MLQGWESCEAEHFSIAAYLLWNWRNKLQVEDRAIDPGRIWNEAGRTRVNQGLYRPNHNPIF
ncbi:uncharacterized protein G2W53_035436 [Senna tora]|uniref:Uncharacterized protein n=1 Tax=Senna tora TaxID=362788 RepID=A0A834SST6_9FABA|nr:uncharacterized protein G2W53_035436 [Senna tora]